MRQMFLVTILCIVLTVSACAGQAGDSGSDGNGETSENATPIATIKGVSPAYTQVASNGKITFTDGLNGISVDYPDDWIGDQIRGGTRSPSMFIFTSYYRIPGMADPRTIDGETVITLTIIPPRDNNSIDALIKSQKETWVKDGTKILSEENVTLANGVTATAFVIDAYYGQAYNLFTVVGGKLIFCEGTGDLEAAKAVCLSIR